MVTRLTKNYESFFGGGGETISSTAQGSLLVGLWDHLGYKEQTWAGCVQGLHALLSYISGLKTMHYKIKLRTLSF